MKISKNSSFFRVEFPKEFQLDLCVASTRRPSFSMPETSLENVIDFVIDPIEIEFIDYVQDSAASKVFKIISNTYTFDYRLFITDSEGNSIEEWLISGCKILSADFGQLDADSKSLTVKMKVQPSLVDLIK